MIRATDKLASVPSKDEVAISLANAHREIDPGILRVVRLIAAGSEGDPGEPIKLLEVNKNTTVCGVMPIYFTAHHGSGVPFASIIVEIHPTEFEPIQKGQLMLPNGWSLGPDL